MCGKTRFIKSILATAAAEDTPLPWQRGAQRAALIARRDDSTIQKRTA